MGLFDGIVNYFYPPAPKIVPASPAQKADSGGDPFFDGLVATVKAGKIPKYPITQEQANPYLTKMYAAKIDYQRIHPEPKPKKEGWGEWFSRKAKELWYGSSVELDKQLIITDVYTKGFEYGKILAKIIGGQDVVLAEDHYQTAQWDAFVGIVDGLKAGGNKRQIIVMDEHKRGKNEDNTELGVEEWNSQTPRQHLGGLGEYLAHTRGLVDVENDYYPKWLGLAKIEPKAYRNVPEGHVLNAVSKISPDVKYFSIDVNHSSEAPTNASRDAAMAMVWQAIRKVYPEAIIIGSFGANHVVEHKVDAKEIADNRFEGADFNDPLAEQLIYARVGKGETDAAERVHTIRVRPTGTFLYNNAYTQPVYVNNGAFDEVWHVAPQEHGINSTWDPTLHKWAKG